MVQATVALRIDVDTRRGLDEGVPRLLDVFRRRHLHASFFVTMGPDRSGLALRRALRPGFLAKMWRTRAWRLYGIRTILSGTLLPARMVGASAPALLRQIADEGHEVAPHGFDHVEWQDRVDVRGIAWARADLARAAQCFADIFGRAPEATAAPGWRITPEVLRVQDELRFRYASDVRGRVPFRPAVGAGALATVQVPTTMPTLDELAGRVPDVVEALFAALRPGLNVLTAHAEVEGGPFADDFERFLTTAGRRGVRFVRLDEAAQAVTAAAEPPPAMRIVQGHVPGRGGWVAVAEQPA
ncbi:MAG: 4-deoxy-4-formamido-L-arabinose-phosphoundecaprenol deformylase [Candidatus Rokubacteria bacterium]|nr:4-deoxy-4-formamido-L-arabinose-phosphoundecaprenol deformylase [Candidatus Rokubacteria bacterium]